MLRACTSTHNEGPDPGPTNWPGRGADSRVLGPRVMRRVRAAPRAAHSITNHFASDLSRPCVVDV